MSSAPTDQELGVRRLTLKDADGQPHEYVLLRHDAEKGLEICFVLLGHAAGAIVPLMEPLLSGEVSIGAILSGNDAAAEKAFEGVDLSKAAAEIKGLLLDPKSVGLVKDLVSETSRDGKPLRIPANFAEAYRGNYFELLRLLWKVIEYNRFFPLSATS
jgi:hypothetical protein